jgi:hypothetical protein
VAVTKQYIISEIKRTAEANAGVPLGMARFEAETGITYSDWFGMHWVRWGDALEEAGYPPNTMQGSYDEEFLIEKLIEFIREIGHYPVRGELVMKAKSESGFPSANAFQRRGKKAEIAAKVIEHCSSLKGFEDIIRICEPVAAMGSLVREIDDSPGVIGYVYLMKSGKYFKIGRSNAVGRREYELGIQLPEKITTVHTIQTDDPAGIEAYWHSRFASKRKGGEWFELTAKDVQAFKRRKFM